MTVYHRKHIQKLVQMVVKAVGATPWLDGKPGGRPALAPAPVQGGLSRRLQSFRDRF